MTLGEAHAMMVAKGVDLEPEENTLQQGSVFGKRFGNGGGVTAAVLECLKETGENADINVMKCNGAAECKKALMLLKIDPSDRPCFRSHLQKTGRGGDTSGQWQESWRHPQMLLPSW